MNINELFNTLSEEWDPERGFIHPNEIKAEKEKKRAELKAKIDSGKVKVRNLDEKPLKRAPLKRDTEYPVGEIAKYCYEHSTKLQGRFEDAKQLEDHLRASKTDRLFCDKKMVEKLGRKKDAKPMEKHTAMGDLIRKAFESNNPAVKELVKDFQNPTALRNALTNNIGWKNQLEKLLGNLNEEDIEEYKFHKAQFNSITDSYEENKGTDFGKGIKWTMEELFGQNWKNLINHE